MRNSVKNAFLSDRGRFKTDGLNLKIFTVTHFKEKIAVGWYKKKRVFHNRQFLNKSEIDIISPHKLDG